MLVWRWLMVRAYRRLEEQVVVVVVGTYLFVVGLFGCCSEGFGALVVTNLQVDLQVGLQVDSPLA